MLEIHLQQVVVGVLFIGIRVGALMSFAPFFSSMAIPWQVKAGLTALITALLYSVYTPHVEAASLAWLRLIWGELAMGLLLGLAVQLIFEGVQVAGQIVGIQVGYSLVNLIDPQTEVDTNVWSVFYQMVLFLIFFQLGVDRLLLRGLAKSFEFVPPGSATFAAGPELLRLAGEIWVVALHMAAPVLAVTLLADILLVFAGRAAPQLPVMFLGMSLKSLLTLAVLFAAAGLWPRMFEDHFQRVLVFCDRVLHAAH